MDLFVSINDDFPVLPLSANEESKTYTIKDAVSKWRRKKIFPYAVYCVNGNGFAEGGTSPAIIIEPRH
jgi:hypothetical protein